MGPVWMPQKVYRDTLCQTFVFASDVICGSHNVFWCVLGVKHERTIFLARVGVDVSYAAPHVHKIGNV
jgi:hypothetical protein